MFKVVLKQARPGMTLARELVDPHKPEAALLGRGDVLCPEVIAFLHESGVYDLWVQEAGLEDLDEPAGGMVSRERRRLCEVVKQGFHAAAQRTVTPECGSQMRDALRVVMQTLAGSGFGCFDTLAKAEEHAIRHGAEVCYLAILLGVNIQDYIMEQRKHVGRLEAKDLVNLGLGCLFHDLGEMQLEEKERESRREENSGNVEWRRHVELGFGMVRNQLEPSAAAVVLNHHQRFDGSGFPAAAGKGAPAGAAIHAFARVAFVADTFVHLLKHDSVPMPTIHALWRLQQPTCRRWSDPVVLAALLALVPPFLPGTLVQLSDRRFGVVTRMVAGRPCKPEVQTLVAIGGRGEEETPARELLNLSKGSETWVQGVDGMDVTAFLYGE